MPRPLLKLHHVSYTYPGGRCPAVQELSLSVDAGQKTVILGHNGCGKSTLLLLAAGLCRCTAGTIHWQGQPLSYNSSCLNQWRQQIGLAFQDPERQLVAATVAEDISYGLCNLHLSKIEIEKRLQQTLIDFSLTDLANVPLHHLSLGQKRRVALAGVMTLQPKLLLLDEPTAYLDSLQTQNLFQELNRIHASGTTVVMATHDVDLAYAWADQIVVLTGGQVALSEQTHAVFSNAVLLEQLQLNMPTLLEVWYALPEVFRQAQPTPPRTIADLRSRLLNSAFAAK